jgi:hypothetical protein
MDELSLDEMDYVRSVPKFLRRGGAYAYSVFVFVLLHQVVLFYIFTKFTNGVLLHKY